MVAAADLEEDTWRCSRCGWTYPNRHPSARHRRKHKKQCGKIKGFELAAPAATAGSSDDASSGEDGGHSSQQHQQDLQPKDQDSNEQKHLVEVDESRVDGHGGTISPVESEVSKDGQGTTSGDVDAVAPREAETITEDGRGGGTTPVEVHTIEAVQDGTESTRTIRPERIESSSVEPSTEAEKQEITSVDTTEPSSGVENEAHVEKRELPEPPALLPLEDNYVPKASSQSQPELWEQLLEAEVVGARKSTAAALDMVADATQIPQEQLDETIRLPQDNDINVVLPDAHTTDEANGTNPFLVENGATSAPGNIRENVAEASGAPWNAAFPDDNTGVVNPFAGGEGFRASHFDEDDIKPHVPLQALFEKDVKREEPDDLSPLVKLQSDGAAKSKPVRSKWSSFICCATAPAVK